MTDVPQGEPIPFVWHPRTRRHLPLAEIRWGVRVPSPEVVDRVNVLREVLSKAGHREVTARDPEQASLLAVHSVELIAHLRTIHDAWVVGGFPTEGGQDRVVPSVFPIPGMLNGLPIRRAAAAHARAGQFCYDTTTLIGPGTWDAAEAAAGAAVTAADLVADAAWQGAENAATSQSRSPMAYALCRPPGHHAAREAFGGSCYLNNAAVAAEHLRVRGARRVAVVDVDAFHGNGTQSIFYSRADVLFASAHVDPAAGRFPHFLGYADESGLHGGEGTNLNLPIPARAGDDRWLDAIGTLVGRVRAYRPDVLVVSLGVNASVDEPGGPLRVTPDGLGATGVLIGELNLPTVIVQEGGTNLKTLGPLVTRMLSGISQGAARVH